MPDRKEPGNTIDGWPEVVAVAFVGGSGMDRSAHAKSIDGAEIFGRNGALHSQRRSDCIFGTAESRAERIADRLEDVALVLGDSRPHQCVVPAHSVLHGSAVALPSLRAALDVCEDEGHRAAGKRPGSASIRHRTHWASVRHECRRPVLAVWDLLYRTSGLESVSFDRSLGE
jgi:hypothetical protein